MIAVSISLLMLVGLSVLASAATELTLPGEGPYRVWTDTNPNSAPRDVIQPKELTVSIESKGWIMVEDVAAGTLFAEGIVPEAPRRAVKLDDFNRIPETRVRVTHLGKPVSAMSVIVTQRTTSLRAMISPSDKGEVTFYGLKIGELTVRLEGRSKGEPISPAIEQRFTLTPKQGSLEISVAQEVDTVGASEPAESKPEMPATTAPEQGNPIGRVIMGLLFLAITAALVLYAYRWVKANPAQVDQVLKKAGIEIPKDGASPTPDDPDAPDPIAAATPSSPSQIILPSDPGLVSASSTVFAPRLVDELGQLLELPEGTHQVTREPGSALSVADPSISRAHARVSVQNGIVSEIDEGSTNGTFVNGNRIDAETQLQPGDTVQFGTKRFRLEG